MVSRILNNKHIVIIAQDAAVDKVMELFDVRCMGLVEGWDTRADYELPPSRICNGREPDSDPTCGWIRAPSSPAEPIR